MADSSQESTEQQRKRERAIAPIRWPHPDATSWALLGLWVVGLVVALGVPAFVVPPSARSPETGAVWTAFGITVLGALIMVAAGLGFWRKFHDSSAAVFGGVPAMAVIFGGLIIVATKLSGA